MDDWVFMSDVCKHCTNAGCLDACPTGALIRTEYQTVVLQADVCNGCGYCVSACPFGVVDRDPEDGRAGKCTLCYDRLEDGLEPACAKSCPTDSIQFGPHEELVEIASRRVAELHRRGVEGAYVYGAGDEPEEQLAGGLGSFFLLTEPPERYGLPAHADSPVQENVVPATLAAVTAGLLASAATVVAFVTTARRGRRTAEGALLVSSEHRWKGKLEHAGEAAEWLQSTSLRRPPADARPSRSQTHRTAKSSLRSALAVDRLPGPRPSRGRRSRWHGLASATLSGRPSTRRRHGLCRRRAGAGRGRGGEPADARRAGHRLHGPFIHAPLWGWEVASYFWLEGWLRARRLSRSAATRPATTAPPRSLGRSRSPSSRPLPCC